MMSKSGEIFKRKLRAGEKLYGTHVWSHDIMITEAICSYGFDYIWVDTEHAPIDYSQLYAHIVTVQSKGIAALVRVPFVEPFLAKRVLEMGPDGVIFPMTDNREIVQNAINHSLYPPQGSRGFGPHRANQFGKMGMQDYLESLDRGLCKFIQIEQETALKNLEEILTVKHLDGVIIGPMDLSFTRGRPGQIYSEQARIDYAKIVKETNQYHVPVGVSVTDIEEEKLAFWHDCGIQFMSFGGDIRFICEGCSKLMEHIHRIR